MVDALAGRAGAGGSSSSCPRRSPPTPATGTSGRSTRSWPTSTSRRWSHPTRAAAAPQRKTGPSGADLDARRAEVRARPERYRNANRQSSRYSVTPNTTKAVIRFHRRGRMKVRTEWRLQMMAHNLTKAPSAPDSHPGGLKGLHLDNGPPPGPVTNGIRTSERPGVLSASI